MSFWFKLFIFLLFLNNILFSLVFILEDIGLYMVFVNKLFVIINFFGIVFFWFMILNFFLFIFVGFFNFSL